MKKRTFAVLAVLTVLSAIAWRFGFSLDYQYGRNRSHELTTMQKSRIESETEGMSVDELYGFSIRFASNELSFSDVNDIQNGRANCVGYALLCSAVFNYAAAANHADGSSRPIVGYVRFLGLNLCSMLQPVMPIGIGGTLSRTMTLLNSMLKARPFMQMPVLTI